MGGPSGEPSWLTASSQDSSGIESGLVGVPVHTNRTRVVFPVSIELLSKTVEHTG